ncbi:hypothetical protein [Pseudorhodoferax sp.]|uniref:hypothetical protein n=1 Tax=Pseudorhodoferax sp. TaxID=1993553 RepID=UPI002DD61A52|nr:hypothetical protein [Pseudorhodoferax sp.]
MDFPSYVPNAVRELIDAYLEGDSAHNWADFGWREALAKSERELRRLEGLLQSIKDLEGLNNVRVEYAKESANARGIGENVASLERLALRPEMQAAYARLVGALGTDTELKAFIRAAWGAHMNYGTFRDRLKEAAEIARKVADAAGALHELLQKAEGFGTYLPGEFFGIRSLLRNTDHDPDDRNHYMWQRLRHVVLGDRPDPLPQDTNVVPLRVEVVLVSALDATPLDPEEQARNMLDYAWGTAPDVRHIVATMQRAAQECVPTETGTIGAALSRQKSNRKTEYLRGFASLLRNEHSIKLTADIMNAMAVTATVVLNDPDTVVTYDDVRKAVANLPL